jgi:anti-sigma regulatory factor (Ser/Thr protein kinase)
VADVVVLLTSELVTNAILHARTDIELVVRCESATIRIEVDDHSPRLPVPRHAAADASSGRGLTLVNLMSGAWGVEERPSGKAVWFEVPA